MLINLEPYGRLGNRLFLAAHLLAFSCKYEVPLLNLGFGEYVTEFPWLEGNAAFAFPWRATGDLEAANRYRAAFRRKEWLPWVRRFRYWGETDLDFDRSEVETLLRPLRLGQDVLFRAWLFRGYDSVQAYRKTILEVLKPKDAIVSEASRWVNSLSSGGRVVIGVHVRWEDYRGTRYYLSQAEFIRHLESLAKTASEPCVFALFSNEPLPAEGWGCLDVRMSPGVSPLFDLMAMAKCDWLVGPPSTFSGWASFYGGVPFLSLVAGSEPANWRLFKVGKG